MPIAAIYQNDAGIFHGSFVPLAGLKFGQAAWADMDGDRDLDLMLVGRGPEFAQAILLQNDTKAPLTNTPPTAPGNLSYSVPGNVTLRWDPAIDSQTPSAGLTYNLRVGRTPGGMDVIAPASDPASGYRRLPAMGNAGQRTSATLRGLAPGTYYWAVQAVDSALVGSPFSAEATFQVGSNTVGFSGPITVTENQPTASITVQLAGPSSQTVSVQYATSNGSALAGSDYQPANGQLNFSPGETLKTIQVTVNDDTLDEDNETIHLTLSNPVNAALGPFSAVDIILQDNDEPPSVRLAADTASVSEGEPSAAVTVMLSAASGRSVTVNYATSAGTATAGIGAADGDYTTTSGLLTFAPGEMSKNINIPLQNDALDEPAETFLLDLSAPTNASLGAPARVTITINDNDPAAQVRFSSTSYAVDEGQGQAVVTVQLSGPSGWSVQAHYAVTGGTATAGSDFVPAQGDLSFAPGETSKTFSVTVLEDALREGDETANLALSGPVNAALGTPVSALLVIHDNEPPEVNFSHTAYTAGEKDSTATITVTLSAPVDRPVTVHYATADLTAKAAVDYVATGGTLSFPAGTTSQSFLVTLIDNSRDNDNKTVSLALSNPVNATLPAGPASAVLTILDDDPLPTVQFEQSAAQVEEGAGEVALTVKLSAGSEKTVTVGYHIVGGVATPDADYTGGEGVLTFAPGETSQSLPITILEDEQVEPGEAILLALYDPNNATTGQLSELELMITDNDPPEYWFYLPIVISY